MKCDAHRKDNINNNRPNNNIIINVLVAINQLKIIIVIPTFDFSFMVLSVGIFTTEGEKIINQNYRQ